jgi:hypothetical protein
MYVFIQSVRRGEGGDRGPQTDKHLPASTFTGKFFKKNRHLGFGILIDFWSMCRSNIFSNFLSRDLDFWNLLALYNGSGSFADLYLGPLLCNKEVNISVDKLLA